MTKKTTLESSIEDVLEELYRIGYCQSTIRNFKKVYDRLLELADSIQTGILSDALADHFINDSAHTRTGQYCHSRKKLHSSCIRKLREYEEGGYVGWKP